MRVLREIGPATPPASKLLDRVREAIRTRYYSRRTEDAYVSLDTPLRSSG
jgi:hypothetical protein